MAVTTTIDRAARTATVRVDGEVAMATVQPFYDELRAVTRRRDVRRVLVDLEGTDRIDSSAVAAVSLVRRGARGKQIEVVGERHASAFELIAQAAPVAATTEPTPGVLEATGLRVLAIGGALRGLGALLADTGRQLGYVIVRKKRLPAGATFHHIVTSGIEALPIVSLLAALLGATIAFQGIVLLQRFGAGVFVADMTAVGMIREFAPMMTAIMIAGRTGASIAAELGTMRVRGELDALSAMGVSPTRFLLLPRLLAITFVQPALTLFAMFVGIAGGALVALAVLHMPPMVFWDRVVDRVQMLDFIHGLAKSFVFAWIIGFAGSYLGMHADADPSAVGQATTRTVVVCVFLIILVDAAAATLSALGGS